MDTCPTCQRKVSFNAKTCPGCGEDLATARENGAFGLLLILILGFILSPGLLYHWLCGDFEESSYTILDAATEWSTWLISIGFWAIGVILIARKYSIGRRIVAAGIVVIVLIVTITSQQPENSNFQSKNSTQLSPRPQPDNSNSVKDSQTLTSQSKQPAAFQQSLNASDPSQTPAQSAPPPASKSTNTREIAPTPTTDISEAPKEDVPETHVDKGGTPATDSAQMRIAELKGELAALNAKIQSERQRWQEGVNVINRLTNFKKTPVREGSPQYHQCMAASRVIQEVEAGAPALKTEKARLEAMIQSLEGK